VKSGVLSTSIGTSGVMFVHSDEVKIDPEGRVHTFCHAVRGKWHLMGVTLSAGGSLQWFRNALCQELARRSEEEGNRAVRPAHQGSRRRRRPVPAKNRLEIARRFATCGVIFGN
jgi:sugar (pentulose or hexulose) kinase